MPGVGPVLRRFRRLRHELGVGLDLRVGVRPTLQLGGRLDLDARLRLDPPGLGRGVLGLGALGRLVRSRLRGAVLLASRHALCTPLRPLRTDRPPARFYVPVSAAERPTGRVLNHRAGSAPASATTSAPPYQT